jgi:hypothetical protein
MAILKGFPSTSSIGGSSSIGSSFSKSKVEGGSAWDYGLDKPMLTKEAIPKDQVFPIPEIFEGMVGRGWTILHHEELSGIDFDKKILCAPLDDSSSSHCKRMQQIGRIKWSDYKKEEMAEIEKYSQIWDALETRRINLFLRRAGVSLATQVKAKDSLFGVIRNDAELLIRCIESHGTGDYKVIQEVYAGHDEMAAPTFELCEEVVSDLVADPTCETVLRLTKMLQELFDFQNMQMPGLDFGDGSILWQTMMGEFVDGKLSEVSDALRKQLPDLTDLFNTSFGQRLLQELQSRKGNLGSIPWGRMEIEEPPLTHNVRSKFNRRWKATEEGVIPRYPHRYFVDKQVFAHRRRIPGGTIIVDASGSMHLSPQEINEIVNYAPGCVVGIYSGNGENGVLRVLAKNGKRAADGFCCRPAGQQNNIDFPALKWAMQYNHPRIWITDGSITGVGDQQCPRLFVECGAVVGKGKFFIKRTADDAIKLLKKLSKHYKW